MTAIMRGVTTLVPVTWMDAQENQKRLDRMTSLGKDGQFASTEQLGVAV